MKENMESKFKDTVTYGDCLKKLQKIEDNSFDHCITDPPYNISGYDNKKEIGWYKSNKTWKEKKSFNKIEEDWDKFSNKDYLDFSIDWISEIKRTVKQNGNIMIFGSYHNIYKLGFILEFLDLRIINSIVWYKRNAFPNITQRMFCESTEQVIWAVNNNVKKAKNWTFNYHDLKELTENKKQMRNMWDIPMTPPKEKTNGKHPSQKPLAVMKRLIIGCTNKKDLVVDPFAGSGSTGVSCKLLNRYYCLIENNKEYIPLIKKRLKNTIQQQSLFQ